MLAQWLVLIAVSMSHDITSEPATRAYLWTLLAEARYGFSENEEAAFIVRDRAGHVTFVRWPKSAGRYHARWAGAFPKGTIAIVHTHPNFTPEPSLLDERAAQRNGVPVYVLTRTKITRTTGDATEIVFDGDWRPRR